LGIKDIEGTYLDYRLKQVIGQGSQSSVLYKPRSGTVNSNLHLYSQEQLTYIKSLCRDQLLFFGYEKLSNEEKVGVNHYNLNTEFFDLGQLSDDDFSKTHGFLKSNKA